ncbi:MAG: hypothetical protein NTU44_13535 [Bacteroidetes bacterium]|nr:hypothetical protein [Bacteroidota bacterium]
MKYLLILTLLLGLIQSCLELRKDKNKGKSFIINILSYLYIAGFIVGLIVILFNDNETKYINNLIQNISFSVKKINSSSSENLANLNKSMNQTKILINKSDSLDCKMSRVLQFKESLIIQYERVNEQLSKQSELQLKQFKERAPNIGLADYDSKLVGTDSTSYSLEVCIRNFGKRTALIYGGKGYVICFDKKNKAIQYNEIRGNNNNDFLEPNEIDQMRLCYSSFGFTYLKYLQKECDYAVICLKVQYEDIAMKKDSTCIFYSGWLPTSKEFGGLKNWQFNVAKSWINKNSDFYK